MDTGQKQTKKLNTFIVRLMEQKGFTHLAKEVRQEIAKELWVEIDRFITTRMLARLSWEELEKFKKLLAAKKSRKELDAFARKGITDYAQFVEDSLAKFQVAYLGVDVERRKTV